MTLEPQRLSSPLRAAFVMEQALGHVTHYRNVRQFVDQQPDVAPTWLPIRFDVAGPSRMVPVFRTNWSVRASWRARRSLDARNARSAFDVLFFHTQVTSLFSLGLMRSIPSIISLDATPINYDSVGVHYEHRPAGTGPIDRQKFELNRRAFHAASGLVTWSEWARRSLIDDYGIDSSKVRVIAPGAPPVFFEIGQQRQEATIDSPNRRAQILFVGGDFRRKGGELLLELMRGPLGQRCDLHLVTHAEVPAQPNVFVYHSLQPNSPELRRLYAKANIFVFPSFADCLPVVLEEAAAAGLPAVITRVGALHESVDDGESGLLVPAGDHSALESAVTSLVEDPGRRERMGRAAHALATRKFDGRSNNRMLVDLLHEISSSPVYARRAA
jgi:glycosyltransferase involved in cell wall biosynthesis